MEALRLHVLFSCLIYLVYAWHFILRFHLAITHLYSNNAQVILKCDKNKEVHHKMNDRLATSRLLWAKPGVARQRSFQRGNQNQRKGKIILERAFRKSRWMTAVRHHWVDHRWTASFSHCYNMQYNHFLLELRIVLYSDVHICDVYLLVLVLFRMKWQQK